MVKRFAFIILAAAVVAYLVGCGKKQQTLEEMQAPMSIETLATSTTETKAVPEATTAQPTRLPKAETKPAETKTAQLPSPEPSKPTTQEIQIALRNAGFYNGVIDGKRGSLTKKAIEDFQKANGLQVDGKVGPKTWSVLNKHLSTVPAEPAAKTKR